MDVEDISFHKKSNEFELLLVLSVYFVVLGYLTDLCPTWTWFLMISGNPSSEASFIQMYAQFAPWCKFTPDGKNAPSSATPYVAFICQ